MKSPPSRQKHRHQVAELTTRLREAEEALEAIRGGAVDAIVVSGKGGSQVFSLAGADTVYRLIVESMEEAALTAAPDGRILFCNRQFSTMLRLPLSSLLGRELADLVVVEDCTVLGSILRVSESRPARERLRFRGRRGVIPCFVSASLIPRQAERSICMVAANLTELVASDSELQRSNEELKTKAAQLRRLAAELAQSEHRERRRIASVLHDGLQQLLVGAQLQMSRMVAESGASPGARRVAELIDEAIVMSRSLAVEISPPIRAGAGLVAGLSWLAGSMGLKHALEVKMTAMGTIGPMAEEVTLSLFLAVQELLLNVAKHAGVRTASLWLAEVGDLLQIRVSDTGTGFDARKIVQASGAGGFGLFSIQERLSLMGGRLVVTSKPQAGSAITLEVPLASLRAVVAPAAAATKGRPRTIQTALFRHGKTRSR